MLGKPLQSESASSIWLLCRLVLAALLFNISNSVLSQDSTVLKGTITNKQNLPVIGAAVRVLEKDSVGLILAYAFTDEKGFYEVKFISPKAYLICIQISNLNYKTINYVFRLNQRNNSVDFRLEEGANELPTVLVKSSIPIIQKGDTTTFNVKSFEKGNEQNIANLLQRLPGLQVSANGRLSFNGREISRVLIEGDDLFENNYETLINNTGTSGLTKISVIENYKDTTNLTNRFTASGETVLNLGYASKKKRIYGDVQAFSGTPISTYEMKSSTISFSKSIKLITNLNRNTNGSLAKHIANLSQEENNNQKNVQSALYSNAPITMNEISPRNIANNRLFYNNSALYGANLKISISPKLNLKSIFSIIDDGYFQTQRKEINYLTNQSVVAFLEREMLQKKDKSFSLENELDWKLSAKAQTKLSVDVSNIRNQGLLFNEINTRSTNQRLAFRNATYYISSQTNLLTGTNHSLSVNLYTTKKSFNNIFFSNNLLVDSVFTQPIANYRFIEQRFHGAQLIHAGELQFNLKKGAFSHNIAATITAQNLQINNGLQLFATDSLHPTATHTDFALVDEYRQQNAAIRYTLGSQINKTLQASLSANFAKINITGNSFQSSKEIFSPSINFQQKVKRKSLWLASFQMSPVYPRLFNLSTNYFLTSVNSVSKGIGLLNITNRFIVNTSYLFFDPIQTGIIGQALFSYSNNPLTYLQNINFVNNLIVNENIVSNEANRFTTIGARIEKKFYKNNSWIILTSNMTEAKVYGLTTNKISMNELSIWKHDVQLKLELSNAFNIRSSIVYQRQVQENKQNASGRFMNTDFSGKFQFEYNHQKRIFVDFTTEYITNNTAQRDPVNVFFTDVQLRYNNKQQLSYFLGCKNIFNQKDLRFSSVSAIQTNVTAFNLFERVLSAGLALKF